MEEVRAESWLDLQEPLFANERVLFPGLDGLSLGGAVLRPTAAAVRDAVAVVSL